MADESGFGSWSPDDWYSGSGDTTYTSGGGDFDYGSAWTSTPQSAAPAWTTPQYSSAQQQPQQMPSFAYNQPSADTNYGSTGGGFSNWDRMTDWRAASARPQQLLDRALAGDPTAWGEMLPFASGAVQFQNMPAVAQGMQRLYHGSGGAGGAGMGGGWFSPNIERAASYGSNLNYVDVPQFVYQQGQQAARKAGSFTGGDAVLDRAWQKLMESITGYSPKTYSLH